VIKLSRMSSNGAVAIGFFYLNKSWIFVNVDLCDGQSNSLQRNEEFQKINFNLDLPRNYKALVSSQASMQFKPKVSDRYD
jgi:hypothetical protein